MKMVGHDAIGEDLYPAEFLGLAEELGEVFLFGVIEADGAIHRAGNAVIESRGSVRRGLESSRSHAGH
jgi:hypothetical protein